MDASTTRVYFRVPNFTGYGPDFDSWDAAAEHVNANWHSEFVSQVIDVREEDSDGDRIVKRYKMENPLAKVGR